jgi:hypothetical protein
MCLRGIDTLTAAGLCAEVGDFARFRHPEQLMSFLGVVPSEQSSGTRRQQGSITKSGSQHARRLLVEAAWHCRQPPRISAPLRRRQAGADPAVVALSWKTERRLHRVCRGWRSATSGADHRRRCGARARRLLLGRGHRLTAADTTLVWEAAGSAGPSRQSVSATPMGTRPKPATPDARRRALRRNPGPAVPNPRISV